jgi:plasmid stabilization system protein ParE
MGDIERIATACMPRLKFSPASITDLARLREFLAAKNEAAADKAKQEIIGRIEALPHMPEAHRPVEGLPFLRDLVIKFGASGYIARYRYERGSDILILRIRHQREAGFDETNQAD